MDVEPLKAPESVLTERLLLRRPRAEDAAAVNRYASDPEVTRFMAWPRHESPEDTRAFLAFSDAEWERWPGGPYLILSREDGTILGGSGFAFEAPDRAETGYVLAKDAWGRGFATEALRAVIEVASGIGVRSLFAHCHPDNRPSWRVLEKCGLAREGILPRHAKFPNLEPGTLFDVLRYSMNFPRLRS